MFIRYETVEVPTYTYAEAMKQMESLARKHPVPKKIIFNPPATIVYWEDGDKTVVKCMDCQQYDEEAGYAAAYMRKVYGTHAALRKVLEEKGIRTGSKEK